MGKLKMVKNPKPGQRVPDFAMAGKGKNDMKAKNGKRLKVGGKTKTKKMMIGGKTKTMKKGKK